MVNKRDVEVFIVCLSCHFDVGLFHVIGHGGTPLAVLDDTYILYLLIEGTIRSTPLILEVKKFEPSDYCIIGLQPSDEF
jgi:hypothetical protein